MNYILYTDNYYSSPKLCKWLNKNGICFLGMIKRNRQGLDKQFQNLSISKGKCLYYKNEELIFFTWNDKKQISLVSYIQSYESLLSTSYNKTTKQRNIIYKPKLIISYAKNFKGVDLNYQICS